MRLQPTLLCGAALAGLMFSESVNAEGICPPGMFPIGGGTGGWVGCAPMSGYSQSGGWNPSPSPPPASRPTPPVDREPLIMREALDTMTQSLIARQEFESRFGKILFSDSKKGAWLMTSNGDAAGKNCVASFIELPNSTNVMALLGPNQFLPGAMLFQGTGLPATREVREIRPVLAFKESKPAQVRAALVPLGNRSGILIPTDMIASMRLTKEASEVTLQLDGKEVFRSGIIGLMTARDAMLQCMRAAN